MTDAACVAFLQWALPAMGLRWPGFRKVRGQVCKRVARRLLELGLRGAPAYSAYLESHPQEWSRLDAMCRITISRFYRDRGVFQFLEREVLPDLAARALARGDRALRCWSAGCAGGEEPYTLAILWRLGLMPCFPALEMRIIATDADREMLRRAARGCYRFSSTKEFPEEWRDLAFTRAADLYCVRPEYREKVAVMRQDLRRAMPDGPFDLILCRNCAFTYFDHSLQGALLRGFGQRLREGGALLVGAHEALPPESPGWKAWPGGHGVYRKNGPAGCAAVQ